MVESIEHKKLKTKARELLKEKYGFNDSQISEEYPYTLKNSVLIIIDVVGKNSEKFIAVECGNTSKLKEVNMKNELGKDNVILLPYDKIILEPLFYKDAKTRKEKIRLLKSIYNEHIFKQLKEDKDFQLFEYNEENSNYFYIGKKRAIWMAFPTKKSTIEGKKLQYEINFTLEYMGENDYEITINAETNDAVKQFIALSERTKNLIIDELKKLPSGFLTQWGIKYKTEKVRMPPYLRNWEISEPIPSNQMDKDKLNEIQKNLEWYMTEGKRFEEYPILSLVNVKIKKEEFAKAMLILKPLYELSFKFRTEKQETAIHDSLKSLKQQKIMYETGLDEEMTEDDYYRVLKAIKEQENSV